MKDFLGKDVPEEYIQGRKNVHDVFGGSIRGLAREIYTEVIGRCVVVYDGKHIPKKIRPKKEDVGVAVKTNTSETNHQIARICLDAAEDFYFVQYGHDAQYFSYLASQENKDSDEFMKIEREKIMKMVQENS